jgi:hypothetical protein
MSQEIKRRLAALADAAQTKLSHKTTPLTIDDVAQRCGLEPPYPYFKRKGRGLTTLALCRAVAIASALRPVGIAAHSHKYSLELVARAREMAKRCDVDASLIDHVRMTPELDTYEQDLVIDHHAFSQEVLDGPSRKDTWQMDKERKETVRAELEKAHGQVWDTVEMERDFKPLEFSAPFIVVRRRADSVKGTLLFTHNPRLYYGFIAEGE